MSLEKLLQRAKEAHREKKAAPGRSLEVVALPTQGHITDYGRVPDEGIREAREAHERLPEDPEIQVYLAFLLYANGEFPEAIRHFQELLEKDFRVANQHFYLGNCFFKQKDQEAARKHWELCLENDPPEGIERLVIKRLDWL